MSSLKFAIGQLIVIIGRQTLQEICSNNNPALLFLQ